MSQKDKNDFVKEEEIIDLFLKNKKDIFKKTLKIFLLFFIALAVNGLALFYPYHFIISIFIFMIAFLFLIKNLWSLKKLFDRNKKYIFIKKFAKKQKKKIFATFLLVIALFSFLVLNPIQNNQFSNLSETEISIIINNDSKKGLTAMDFLETTGSILLKKLDSKKEDTKNSIELKNSFDNFLKAIIFSEEITDRNKFFNSLKNDKLKRKSFLIGYSLYIKKYEIIHKIINKTSGNKYKEKILNQYSKDYGRNNMYSEISKRFFDIKTAMRINGGYVILNNDSDNNLENIFKFLKNNSIKSYTYLKNNLDKTFFNFSKVQISDIQNKMFDSWFPIQKKVANSIGHTIISTRGNNGLLKDNFLIKIQEKMNPGDIMLQRRNWHLTNVGIPGFWTHSALYTGTLKEMNEYFKPIFPYNNFNTFEELLKEKYPKIYFFYKNNNLKKEIEKISVIEAIEPGVVLQNMKNSGNADFIIALRPILSKQRKLEAILTAFSNYGKSYDYNFDFETRDSLVCSELIYDAYYPLVDDIGVHFKESIVNGRKMVAPIDIAKKFKLENNKKDKELEFVFFIKSDEKTGKNSIGTEKDFIESVEWSKYTFDQLK